MKHLSDSHGQKCVMVTSDHNMTGSENGENSSESTLKKWHVRIIILIQVEEGMEKGIEVVKRQNVLCAYFNWVLY